MEGPKSVIQELESHALHVGPVASHLHVSPPWRNEVVGVRVTPDGTRGALMANRGSCFPSEMEG